ncbi:MAG: CvpA family protein [Burkholderiales bacterium]
MMGAISSLTWIDWCVLSTVLVSLILGAVRGMVQEFFSLLGWVVAFWLAKSFSMIGASWLVSFISSETIRQMVSFAMFFVVGLIITGLLGYLMNAMVASAGLGTINRVLGALFGLIRGGLLVVLLVLLAGMTSLPSQREWKSSIFIDWCVRGGKLLLPYLPTRMAEHVHF